MNPVKTPQTLTLSEVYATNNYIIAKSHAEAYAEAGKRFNSNDGPITSKQVLVDKDRNKVVYEYYRVRNKCEKFYAIF